MTEDTRKLIDESRAIQDVQEIHSQVDYLYNLVRRIGMALRLEHEKLEATQADRDRWYAAERERTEELEKLRVENAPLVDAADRATRALIVAQKRMLSMREAKLPGDRLDPDQAALQQIENILGSRKWDPAPGPCKQCSVPRDASGKCPSCGSRIIVVDLPKAYVFEMDEKELKGFRQALIHAHRILRAAKNSIFRDRIREVLKALPDPWLSGRPQAGDAP